MHYYRVPTVCTGLSYKILHTDDSKTILSFLVSTFYERRDFAMMFLAVNDSQENCKEIHKVFNNILNIPFTVVNTTTIYNCSPMYLYKAIDQFMASEESEQWGYRNYSYLSGNSSSLGCREVYIGYQPYVIGEDSFNNTNKMGWGTPPSSFKPYKDIE